MLIVLRIALRRTLAFVTLALVVACDDGAPREQRVRYDSLDDRTLLRVAFEGASLPVPPVERMREQSRTIVIRTIAPDGRLVADAPVEFAGSTGWIADAQQGDTTGAGRWFMPGRLTVRTDSTGRARIRWFTGGGDDQRLATSVTRGERTTIERFTARFDLAAVTTPLRDAIAVPSGLAATCVLRAGRVGCIGLRDDGVGLPAGNDSALTLRESLDSLTWLRLAGPAVSLQGRTDGACALLADGRVSCWRALGPRSGEVPIAEGIPLLRDLRNEVGIARDGTVGIVSTVSRSGVAPRYVWLPYTRDVAITRLASYFGGTMVCGMTADDHLYCAATLRDTIGPSPFFPLVDDATGAPIRAIVAEARAVNFDVNRLYWATSRDSAFADGFIGGLAGHVTGPVRVTRQRADMRDLLAPVFGGVGSCVRAFDSECLGPPWRSVTLANPREAAQRLCAVRDVVVCRTRVVGSLISGTPSEDRIDTLRVRVR